MQVRGVPLQLLKYLLGVVMHDDLIGVCHLSQSNEFQLCFAIAFSRAVSRSGVNCFS